MKSNNNKKTGREMASRPFNAAMALALLLAFQTSSAQAQTDLPNRNLLNANHCDGDLEVEACLGVVDYRTGEYRDAVRIWRELAEDGDVVAQRNLGLMYQRGRGVRKNLREASRWYRRAADQDDAGAQFALGAMYQTGQGMPQDHGMASALYRQALTGGSARAAYRLAMMHRDGTARAPDDDVEMRYLRIAAFRGLPEAQLALGKHFFRRNRATSDKVRACAFLRLAADMAFEPLIRREAADWVFRVQDDIDLDQTYQCRKIAREWRSDMELNGGRAPF